MATESIKISGSFSVPRNGQYSSSDMPVRFCKSNVQDNQRLVDFLDDFESYWQDINDRLIISRVVSDSVVKGMVNAVSQDAAEMVSATEAEVTRLTEQLLEGQILQQLQAELEVIVMENAVRSLREEYDKGLLDSQFCVSKTICWRDNLKVISSVCQDLDSVQKSLFNLEKLSSQGSLETDHFHCRVLTNHVSPSTLLWEANGRHKESNVNLPENFESSRLKHLTIDGLYSHFRDIITELKRDHETTVQAMTEDYFTLKREFLKERESLKEMGSFLPFKSKDFDTLRKKIPDVISKLNGILLENEDFSETCDLSMDRLENLLAENRYLRDLLNDKKSEVKCLSSQVSEAEGKLVQHILDEACLSEMTGDLKKSLEDANMEASVNEEVYNCILRELESQIKHDEEEKNMKSIITQDTLAIVYEEAIRETEAKMRLEYGEILNMQTTTDQEMSGIIFQEVLKDMEVQLKNLKKICLQQDELIVSLESEATAMEKTLVLEAEEKHKLRQKILELEALIEAKDKSLITEKQQFEKELNKMMEFTKHQEALIFEGNCELGKLKDNLEDSLQQNDWYKDQMDTLNIALEQAQLDSRRTVLQERNNIDLLLDAKDKEYREQIESIVHVVQQITRAFVNFELQTIENVKWNSLRIENSTFQLDSLIKKANVLRRTRLLYKQRLERRCSDLQKAEAEVDLLGDEVEALLSLLEKMYIALDHYSPILQHYPGIMEILKLVKRELSEECTRSSPHTSIR